MPLGTHTDHRAALSTHIETLFPWNTTSAQPAIDMYWSDAMALFVVVGILDLAQAYMEPMETTTVNLHASGHTY